MNQNTFDYQEFLNKKHSTLQTPDKIIANTVLKATGKKLTSKKKLIVGETNEVYDVTLEDNTHVIIRISHGEQNRFINEEWAMEEVKKHSVPVAKILLIDEDNSDTSLRLLCVMTKLPGTPLSEIKDYGNNQFTKNILIQAGKLLSQIHKVSTYGYGELLNRGHGEHKTYEEWIQKIISREDTYKEVAQRNKFEEEIVEQAIEILKKHVNLFQGEKPTLCHSDFAPKHLMVEKDTITGIIDFGNCHGGSPIHDFAWWQYWHQNYQEIEWLKEGYTDKSIFSSSYETKFHILKFIIGLELFWWNDHVGHLGGVELSKSSIHEDVAFFNHD